MGQFPMCTSVTGFDNGGGDDDDDDNGGSANDSDDDGVAMAMRRWRWGQRQWGHVDTVIELLPTIL